MSKNSRMLWIKMSYLKMISSGKKRLEARIDYPNLRKIKRGSIINFCSGEKNLLVKVIAVRRYKNFSEMLQCEFIDQLLPGYNFTETLGIYRSIYPDEKVKKFGGIIIFEIEKI